MNRRGVLRGGLGALVFGAGCIGGGSDGTTETDDSKLQLGDWADVADGIETRPTGTRSADRVVFDNASGDDVEWTASDGRRFLLVKIELKVTDAPEGETRPLPDPNAYRVRADGNTYEPRESPESTTYVVEPVQGAYAMKGAGGAEGTTSINWLAFEVSDDVNEADVEIRYVDVSDGEPAVWQVSGED